MSNRDQGNGQERGREPPVHSANKWESANFGDDDQKQKFLRLMGGKKKQHTGRFVIGESTQKNACHSRTDDENKKMEETLQSQYKDGLEAKISGQNRRHVGLGFSEPEKTEEEKPKGMHTQFSDSGDESDDKQDQDRKEDAKEKRSDEKQERERKEDRKERRRDDDASSSREKHHRDRDERSNSREDDRKYDRDEKSRQTKEGRKHQHEEESEEISERKRKKHKDKKHRSDSD